MPTTIESLKAYHKLSHEMHQHHDYDGTHGRLQQVAELEDEILSSYGLPSTTFYSEIFQELGWRDSVSEEELVAFEKHIRKHAESFLLSEPKSDEELMQYGLEHLSVAQNVLPLMGLRCSAYQCFVYEVMWLRRETPVEELLEELQASDKTEVVEEELTIANTGGVKQSVPLGIYKYEAEYHAGRMAIMADILTANELEGTDFNADYEYPDVLNLLEYWLLGLSIQETSTVLTVGISLEEEWHRIVIFVKTEKLMDMLNTSPNYALSSVIRAHVQSFLDLNPMSAPVIDLMEGHDSVLKLVLPIAAGRMHDEDDEEDNEPVDGFVYFAL